MIINHDFRFSFLHIPKCGGTSIRKYLLPFDSLEGNFDKRVDNHPALGKLDYVHIPLFTLRDHFPEEFDVVCSYWSFAVIRDPLIRFASSISQRLDMYSDHPIRRLGVCEVEKEIGETLEFLDRQPLGNNLLPPEYIHFQKQVDYIMLDGQKVIDTVYRIDDLDILIKDVGRCIGKPLATVRKTPYVANKSVAYKSEMFGKVIDASIPFTGFLVRRLPDPIKQAIVHRMFVPLNAKFKHCFNEPHVVEFIKRYYARDIRIWQNCGA